jgi:hypothetical protein
VIAKDSIALQAADRVIAAKDSELVEALKPKVPKRIGYTLRRSMTRLPANR